jgi:hypothetical protein
MDADRLRTGELIAGIAGVALFIIMFLPWFGVDFGIGEAVEEAQDLGFDVPEVEDSVNFNAWESFDVIDLVLLVTVVVSVGLAAATAMARTVALPVAASAITAGLGILSTVLILYRLIDPIGEGGVDRKFGIFLGLIAAAAIAYGGWRAMQEEPQAAPPPPPQTPAPPPREAPPPPSSSGTGAPPAGPTV